MPVQKISGQSVAIYLGPSATALYALCDQAANIKIPRAQAVQEEITYCLVEPVAGPKTAKISGKLYITRNSNTVTAVTITNGGSAYTSAPTVSFTGGGGTGAAGIAVIDVSTGKVISVLITNNGTGYTSAPTVAFTGGGGASAAGTAVINSWSTDWMDPLFYGSMSVGSVIYFEIRQDGTGTGRPVTSGYFIPSKYDATYPSDKGAIFVEFEGVTNGWPVNSKQP